MHKPTFDQLQQSLAFAPKRLIIQIFLNNVIKNVKISGNEQRREIRM